MRHIVSQVMPCTTIIIRHFAPSVSIIGRCRIRAVTLRDNNRPMQQKAYRDLRRSASDLNSSPMPTSRVSASRAEPADRALRSRTIPIAAKPRIASRAFVQSGFNEVASQAPAASSRQRDLTEPSRFPNQGGSDSTCWLGRRPAWMGRAYSLDLRERVVGAVLKRGLSCRQAAAQFGVGISTAILWVQRFRETGGVEPDQIGV